MIKPGVVGIVPAAGKARRLGPLPCSKEIFPIGFQRATRRDQWQIKVVAHYLLDHFREAGIAEAIFVVRHDKADIERFLGDGHAFGVNLRYCVIEASPSSPVSVDLAFEYIGQRIVALGFPDILYDSCGAYEKALARLELSGADVVLGLFPACNPHMVDMVDIDSHGMVTAWQIKPESTVLKYQWTLAVWTPRFSTFMHELLDARGSAAKRYQQLLADAPHSELYMSDVLIAAQREGLKIEAIVVSNKPCIDMGTPQTLHEAMRRYASKAPWQKDQ